MTSSASQHLLTYFGKSISFLFSSHIEGLSDVVVLGWETKDCSLAFRHALPEAGVVQLAAKSLHHGSQGIFIQPTSSS